MSLCVGLSLLFLFVCLGEETVLIKTASSFLDETLEVEVYQEPLK